MEIWTIQAVDKEMNHLEEAFWKIADQLIVDRARLEGLWPQFEKHRNDPKRTYSIIEQCLPEGTWEWPEFIAHQASKGVTPTFKEMCKMLYSRIERVSGALRTADQISHVIVRTPYLLFRAGLEPRPECRAADGRVEHYTNEFWEHHTPPCDWLECSCRIFVDRKMR
ncbi:hypothetical protein [Methylococcus mesophilus]|uniref:hypothetical protein n=1 Tax=Methylococcus mesophilus TaxID=2993564 RepID=UPI00224B479F|nr:hypothetical protein [Methylococcus mesophilus]UZR27469.1 hypothetical protein OOT43_12065 [Methylococcus mesophilus]